MVFYQNWPLPGSAQGRNRKGFVGCVKVKYFNRNPLQETRLSGKKRLKQQSICLLTFKQTPVFWVDIALRTSGATECQEGSTMCHMRVTHDGCWQNHLPPFHNMIWKPLWYWENCSYTWLSCSASFLHDFLFMFACSSLKNSAFTLHWLFEVIHSLPDFCFLAQIKIYLCPSHMNKKDQNLRYKHVSDVKKNVIADIQLIFIFCCSMFYEVIINTELLSTEPLPLGKTQG